ncbi:MAG TPA: hypothetical protein VKD65_02670 [Candidatus Angelobacter sp.]|nr:hypothetical protein [Candidatus Angelobacter sp.]
MKKQLNALSAMKNFPVFNNLCGKAARPAIFQKRQFLRNFDYATSVDQVESGFASGLLLPVACDL